MASLLLVDRQDCIQSEPNLSIWTSTMARNYSGSYTNPMKSEDYAHGDAFQSKNARSSQVNGCRSQPPVKSPSPATSCRPRWAAGASSACAFSKEFACNWKV